MNAGVGEEIRLLKPTFWFLGFNLQFTDLFSFSFYNLFPPVNPQKIEREDFLFTGLSEEICKVEKMTLLTATRERKKVVDHQIASEMSS